MHPRCVKPGLSHGTDWIIFYMGKSNIGMSQNRGRFFTFSDARPAVNNYFLFLLVNANPTSLQYRLSAYIWSKPLLLLIGQGSGLLLLIGQGSGLLLLIGQGRGLLLLIGQDSGLLLSIIIAYSVPAY
jgi:hypothetical protein